MSMSNHPLGGGHSTPEGTQLIERLVERKNMTELVLCRCLMNCITSELLTLGTALVREPYAGWCERPKGVTPRSTRLLRGDVYKR